MPVPNSWVVNSSVDHVFLGPCFLRLRYVAYVDIRSAYSISQVRG